MKTSTSSKSFSKRLSWDLRLGEKDPEASVSSLKPKLRFSPLCCALLLGSFPLLGSSATTTSGNAMTITGNHTGNIDATTSSITSIINRGTLSGSVTVNKQQNETLNFSNEGTITGLIKNVSGLLNINNQSNGVVNIRSGLFIRNDSPQGISITNSGILGAADYNVVQAYTGTVFVTNTNLIQKAIKSHSQNSLGQSGRGDANLNITNSGTMIGDILHESSGRATIINTGSMRIVSVGGNGGRGTATLSNTNGTVGSIYNRNASTLSVSSSGTIGSISNSGRFSLSSTGGTIANITNSSSSASITNSGRSTIGTISNQSGVISINNQSGAAITFLSNASGATLNLSTNQGIIGSISNQGRVSTDVINNGTLGGFDNSGTLLGTLNNQTGGVITNISNTGSGSITGGINNAGTITGTINNTSSSGLSVTNSGSISNVENSSGSLSLTSSGGSIGTINSSGTSATITNQSGGSITSINSSGTSATITNNASIGTLNNQNGTATITNSANLGTINNQSGVISISNQSGGTIASISSSGTSAGINNSASIGSIDNQSGTATITNNTGGTIASISNSGSSASISNSANLGTINNQSGVISISNQSGGTIASISNQSGTATLNNQGTIMTNVSNAGTLSFGASIGTILGSLDNQAGGIILGGVSILNGVSLGGLNNQGTIDGTIDNRGTIASVNNGNFLSKLLNGLGGLISGNISNSGTIDNLSNQGSMGGTVINNGAINTLDNTGTINTINNQNGTVTLNNQGTITTNVSNTGTLSLVGIGTVLGTLDNQGMVNGTVNNTDSAFIKGGIKNTGTFTGTISNSSSSGLSISNSGVGSINDIRNSNGSLNLTHSGGTITSVSNSGTGALSVNSTGGVITNITNAGSLASISNQNGGTIDTINNQNSMSILNKTGGVISSISNANNAVLSFNTNQGAINSIRNQGTINTLDNEGSISTLSNQGIIDNDLSNSGILTNLINSGSLQGTLNNQVGGRIDSIKNTGLGSIDGGINNAGSITGSISHSSDEDLSITNTGFIAKISNAATATLTNSAGGVINFISNTDDGTLNLDNNQGTVALIINQGAIEGGVNNSGTIKVLYNEFDGIIHGDISNTSFIGEIDNEGVVMGTISNSSSSVLNISNSGDIIGGIKALSSASINITSDEDSTLGGVYNEGSGQITLSGLTIMTRNAKASSSYDITNSNSGSIRVKNLFVDLQPYVESYAKSGNFSGAYASRVSLGGQGLNAIGVDHITVKLVDPSLLDVFLARAINVSQFINGALGNSDRTAHDCSGARDPNCISETTSSGDVRKIYVGSTLIDGLQDNVGDENFITIEGANSFALTLADKYGNFNIIAKPESSGAAYLNKTLLSSVRKRINFVNNVATASMGEFKYYLRHSTINFPKAGPRSLNQSPEKLTSTQGLYSDRNELYASIVSDLSPLSFFNNASKDHTIFVLPYFTSHSISLDNGDHSKGHSTGIVLGYTSVTTGGTFYSLYGGYEDTDSSSNIYDTESHALYTGFKISDPLRRFGDDAELVAQYDGSIARMQNSIQDNDKDVNIQAHPKSYSWSLGADLGVNFFRGKDIFAPQVGLGYEGGIVNEYRLDVPFEKTKVHTYHTRAKMTWSRDWASHLQTVFQVGLRYYFNPNIEFGYELLDNRISGKTKLPQWNQFVGADFVVPLNEAFYFKLSYNGVFNKDGNSHTALANFNYLF